MTPSTMYDGSCAQLALYTQCNQAASTIREAPDDLDIAKGPDGHYYLGELCVSKVLGIFEQAIPIEEEHAAHQNPLKLTHNIRSSLCVLVAKLLAYRSRRENNKSQQDWLSRVSALGQSSFKQTCSVVTTGHFQERTRDLEKTMRGLIDKCDQSPAPPPDTQI